MNRKKSKENKEHDANRKERRESIANRTQKCNPNPNPRGERARGLPGPRVTAAAGARDAFAPPLAGHLGTEKPPLAAPGRWGRACGAREPGAIHGELDGGALTHRRARAPASKPRWRRPAHSAGPPWPAAVASVSRREKGEGKNELGFEGRRVVVGFDPAKRAGDRSIKIDGPDRASPPGPAGGPCGRGEETPRRADSAARPLAVGPRAQGKVPEQAAGRFASGPPEQCLVLLFFLFFQKQFQ